LKEFGMARIVHKRVLAPRITEFVIEAPLIARKRKPGNFVIVRVNDYGERIPLTICDANLEEGTITLIVQAVGKTTKLLSACEEGESIQDVVGPLGNPSPIQDYGTVVCIGGGVGTAEVYPIAEALKKAGNVVHTIIGARSSELIILEEEMKRVCDAVSITTEDGSKGRTGFVTDELRAMIESGVCIDAVYAIGPVPMMKAVVAVTKPYEIQTLVSLNPIMLDGTGMCGGCRVTVGKEIKFACVDGPEFDGHLVNFEELVMRNKTYLEEEQLADEAFSELQRAEGHSPKCQAKVVR
jgi:ferredoxin--NADP+ reductase